MFALDKLNAELVKEQLLPETPGSALLCINDGTDSGSNTSNGGELGGIACQPAAYLDKAKGWLSFLEMRNIPERRLGMSYLSASSSTTAHRQPQYLCLCASSQQELLFDMIDADCREVRLSKRRNDLIPVYKNREDAIANVPKNVSHFLLREERAMAVVHPRHMMKAAMREIEAKLVKYLWSLNVSVPELMVPTLTRLTEEVVSIPVPSTPYFAPALPEANPFADPIDSQEHIAAEIAGPPQPEKKFIPGFGEKKAEEELLPPPPVILCDPITGEPTLQSGRTIIYFAPIATGIALGLNVFMTSGFIGKLLIETLIDGDHSRLPLLAVTPFFVIISQFLWDNLVSFGAQMFFPVMQLHENTLYYSGRASEPLPNDYPLPSFTIHMPCYKEGLQSVLAPSLESAMGAVEAYRAMGGVANIVVSEDGMRLLKREEAEERIEYYKSLGCGWVARPGHGEDGYNRKGRFKKASNLNFTYNFSLEVEENMDEMRQLHTVASEMRLDPALTSDEDREEDLYQLAFQKVVEQSEGKVWAEGNVRMGDYILLIDCDTRMKPDCLAEAAAEMERCPEVGALQHCSGVMYARGHYFERFVGYFTACCINFSISWVCANGAMAPLMGHNVFLRWRAMQQVSFYDDDGERCVFSPHHVSEDFEMALKLQMKGYIVRWATYSDEGFTEGVSFTPEDEVTRYQKYAYGCSEIVFNPVKYWLSKGPLSKLFRNFLFSDVPLAYKISTLSYMSTYYALGVAFPLTIALFITQGLFAPWLDPVFLPNFDVWITVTLVFTLAGGPGLIISRARCGHHTFTGAVKDALTHLPATVIFFSGLNFHIMTALFSHLFGFHMSWTTTNKDFNETSISQLLKRFWQLHVISLLCLFGIIVAQSPIIPLRWRIDDYRVLLPPILMLALHMLFPVLLDPGMLHKYLPDIGGARTLMEEKTRTFFHAAGARIKQTYDTRRKNFKSGDGNEAEAVPDPPTTVLEEHIPTATSSSASSVNHVLSEKA